VRIVEQGRPEDKSFQQALEFIRANNEKLLAESDVAVSRFEEVADAKMSTLMRFLYLLLVFDVLAFAGTFLLLRRLVLTPLHEIRRSLAVLSRGNLDHRLTLRTGDELQEVAEEVNLMADHLQASYATLEQRVAERTQELTQANRELRRLDRVRSDLLANVSHELKTPLIPISSLAQLMLGGKAGPLTSEQHNYLDAMLRSTQRLQHFSDQLLGTVRRDRGREPLQLSRLDLCQVLRESAGTISPAIKAKGLHLDLHLPDEPLWVQGDNSMLRQVFDNLLGNAAKFTPEAGQVTLAAWSGERGASSVERGAKANDQWSIVNDQLSTNGAALGLERQNRKSKIENPKLVTVEVSDTGMGISEEDRPRIFERFYQAAGGDYVGGTGLGLAIVKELVELHRGSVSVRSVVGKGSTFTVILPEVQGPLSKRSNGTRTIHLAGAA